MKSLDLLVNSAPPWVDFDKRSNDSVQFSASPKTASGSGNAKYQLEAKHSKHGGICVLEQPAFRQLPAFCLERHINPGGTFCLYLNSETELKTVDEAKQWWENLQAFLNNQRYADNYHVWPIGAGLSHGDAAHHQIAMEKIAEPLGWKQELWRSIFRGKGWLAGRLPRISGDKKRILNARSPCPRGCTWKHGLLRKNSCDLNSCHANCLKVHKPVLRANCPHRSKIDALVLHEYERRRMEADIISKLRKDGKKCCGTMSFCPLNCET